MGLGTDSKAKSNFLRKLSLSTWLVISFVTLIIDYLHRDNLQNIRSTVLNVATPIIKVIETPVEWVKSANNTFVKFQEISDDNVMLKNKIIELEEYKNNYFILKQENVLLKKLLKYNSRIEKSFIASRVIGNTGGIFKQTLLLDRGSKDGVKDNDGVMSVGGLLGKIVETSYNNSRVLLLTDSNSAVPVFIMGSNERAIMIGNDTEVPVLKFINKIENVEVGQKIISSGDGGMLPHGIPIGEVSKIEGINAMVKLYTDSSSSLFTRIVKFKNVRK
ncbi:MAG: rod shape-determining protein MreC [Alphaproteobacteria bacterium]